MSSFVPVSARRSGSAAIWPQDDDRPAGNPQNQARRNSEISALRRIVRNHKHRFIEMVDAYGVQLNRAPVEIVLADLADWQAGFGWAGIAPAGVPKEALLAEALEELAQVSAAAAEDGLELPSETALTNARRLLEAMHRISPRRYAVYPEPGGYVAIDARGANNGIAVVMCDSEGGALCLVTIDDEPRRARYATTRKLPDGFIRDALRELGAEPA